MGDDPLDAPVPLHHLLVVTAALVGGPRPDSLTNLHVDAADPPLVRLSLEQIQVLLQEAHVEDVFLPCPELDGPALPLLRFGCFWDG